MAGMRWAVHSNVLCSVTQLWMLCDLKIQFDRAMNDGKYHLAEPHVTAIAALNKTEGLYR